VKAEDARRRGADTTHRKTYWTTALYPLTQFCAPSFASCVIAVGCGGSCLFGEKHFCTHVNSLGTITTGCAERTSRLFEVFGETVPHDKRAFKLSTVLWDRIIA
jgi:hypothetical protein